MKILFLSVWTLISTVAVAEEDIRAEIKDFKKATIATIENKSSNDQQLSEAIYDFGSLMNWRKISGFSSVSLVKNILKHPGFGELSKKELLEHMRRGYSQFNSQYSEVIEALYLDPNRNVRSFVANTIRDYRATRQISRALREKVIRHYVENESCAPGTDYALEISAFCGDLADAIFESDLPLEEKSKLLEVLRNKPQMTGWDIGRVAKAFADIGEIKYFGNIVLESVARDDADSATLEGINQSVPRACSWDKIASACEDYAHAMAGLLKSPELNRLVIGVPRGSENFGQFAGQLTTITGILGKNNPATIAFRNALRSKNDELRGRLDSWESERVDRHLDNSEKL